RPAPLRAAGQGADPHGQLAGRRHRHRGADHRLVADRRLGRLDAAGPGRLLDRRDPGRLAALEHVPTLVTRRNRPGPARTVFMRWAFALRYDRGWGPPRPRPLPIDRAGVTAMPVTVRCPNPSCERVNR